MKRLRNQYSHNGSLCRHRRDAGGGVAHFEERVVGRLVGVAETSTRRAAPSPKLLRPGRERSIKRSVFMPATFNAALDRKQVTLGNCSRARRGKSTTPSRRRSSDLDTTLAGRAGEIGEGLVQRINEISMALAGRLGELEGAARGARSSAAARIGGPCGRFARALRYPRREIGRDSYPLAATRSPRDDKPRRKASPKRSRAVEPPSCSASERSNTKLTAAIEHATADFARGDRNRRRRVVGALVDTNEKLRTGMTEVINRLVNSSAGLQRAISATGNDFAAAEHSLSERMDNFRSIFTNVAGEINQLNRSTRAALDEASSLAETSHATKIAWRVPRAISPASKATSIKCSRRGATHSNRLSTASRRAAKTWKA